LAFFGFEILGVLLAAAVFQNLPHQAAVPSAIPASTNNCAPAAGAQSGSISGGSSATGDNNAVISSPNADNVLQDTPALEAQQQQQADAAQKQFNQQQDALLAQQSQQDPVNSLLNQEQQPVNQLHFDPPTFDSLQMNCSQ
jgi:hypothetical protein